MEECSLGYCLIYNVNERVESRKQRLQMSGVGVREGLSEPDTEVFSRCGNTF